LLASLFSTRGSGAKAGFLLRRKEPLKTKSVLMTRERAYARDEAAAVGALGVTRRHAVASAAARPRLQRSIKLGRAVRPAL